MKKKLLAVLLAIVMVTSVAVGIPILAAGVGEVGYRFVETGALGHEVPLQFEIISISPPQVKIIGAPQNPDGSFTPYNGAYNIAPTVSDNSTNYAVTQVDNAFYMNSGLTSVILPEGITSITANSFQQCTNLISVTLPESLTSINSGAFQGCSKLTSITIPENVTSLGAKAFTGCLELQTLTFSGNSKLTTIPSYAFFSCAQLTSVTIPESITIIADTAFNNCKELATVNFLGVTAPSFAPDCFDDIKAGAVANVPYNGSYDKNAYPFIGDSPLKLVYEALSPLPIPVATPNGRDFPNAASPQSISITCIEPDAAIFYTTDGSEPDEYSAKYTAPIQIGIDLTLKAKAFKAGWLPSATMVESYTFTPPLPDPCEHPSWTTSTKPATTTSTGLITHICTVCGFQKSEIIPMLPSSPPPRSSDSCVAQYEILALYTEGGKISPYNVVYVDEGADQTFTLQPDEGYRIEKLLLDGKPVSFTDRQFTITDVRANHELAAYYVKIDVNPEPPKPTPMPQTGDSLLEKLI